MSKSYHTEGRMITALNQIEAGRGFERLLEIDLQKPTAKSKTAKANISLIGARYTYCTSMAQSGDEFAPTKTYGDSVKMALLSAGTRTTAQECR